MNATDPSDGVNSGANSLSSASDDAVGRWSPLEGAARQCVEDTDARKAKTRRERIRITARWLRIVADEITERAPAIPRLATYRMLAATRECFPGMNDSVYRAIWAAMWEAALDSDARTAATRQQSTESAQRDE